MRVLRVLAAVIVCASTLAGPARAASEAGAQASLACIKCHDADDLTALNQALHTAPRKASPTAAASQRTPNCIACHGASANHVTRPEGAKERPPPDRRFGKGSPLPPAERNAVCLTCHDRDAKNALWRGSPHESADMACSSCHKVHTHRDKVLAKSTQADTCFDCHKDQRAQIRRPSHHPIPEGKMTCSDCHNAHGSAGPKLVTRSNTNDTCYGCHAEKRGPFVHAHEPVTDDCMNCHNAHGSTVVALLKARVPVLCQQCHTPHALGHVGALAGQPGVLPPAVPGQAAPAVTAITSGKNVVSTWQGRSCTNCHTQVHGSNNPSATPTPKRLFR
jgi:DmsE family decaheme c-type cytochrome